MSNKITIVGAAGTVGSCTAFNIAMRGLTNELIMIDANHNQVMAHIIDISTAVATEQEMVIRDGKDEDMRDSDIVIMSAVLPMKPGSSRADSLCANVHMVQHYGSCIKRYCPDAVVITATNPVDAMNYAMYLSSGLDRKKVIGYSLNDTIRFKIAIAKLFGVKATQVQAVTMGKHTLALALIFSSINVNGKKVAINDVVKNDIRKEVPELLFTMVRLGTGRSAGWTSAAGLTSIVRAIVNDSQELLPNSIVLDGEYGYHDLSMTVPTVISKDGVQKVLEWELPPDEIEDLKRVTDVLKNDMFSVRNCLA